MKTTELEMSRWQAERLSRDPRRWALGALLAARMRQRPEDGRRVEVAPLTRRGKASTRMCEWPDPSKNIESERDVLVKTQSLLVCIAQAMGGDHAPTGPYYPDVVGLAQELLKSRVFNLDELLLDGRLPGRPEPQSR